MPVYWFAISCIEQVDLRKAALLFIILHLLLYPASNGYNSYMDRDESPIGGLKNPMQPTRQLYWASVALDGLALLLAWLLHPVAGICTLLYLVFSRLYSYRGIRLKQYPIIGYLTVIANQGALVFYLVYHVANQNQSAKIPLTALLAATCLIGGFYPITQVYQHRQDAADNVKTLSMKLGVRGTFAWCAFLYTLAFALLGFYFHSVGRLSNFLWVQIVFTPVILLFVKWWWQVSKNELAANHENTMRINWVASTCSSLAFIILIVMQYFE